ncbi:hypothetical protein O6H91_20G019800 [Diphasiastrum complanatum]|uniref:Uncharacterized protein n=1 Tax=Diphasiastrum complanatum TaxID=34168 RepID=A0ACC2APZ9_DIPCM|nr:hypothetical protein O6H91_20G019800 [Diphasiastrum complanatum]
MGSLSEQLSKKTNFFDLRLWVILCFGVGGIIIIILLLLLVWLIIRSKAENTSDECSFQGTPTISKEIKEVSTYGQPVGGVVLTIMDKSTETKAEKVVLHIGFGRKTDSEEASKSVAEPEQESGAGSNEQIESVSEIEEFSEGGKQAMEHQMIPMAAQIGKRRGISQFEQSEVSEMQSSEYSDSVETPTSSIRDSSHIGWGQWFALEDLRAATDGFSENNVVGEGGYGIVYRGQLSDGALVAVKNLLSDRKQAEQEFKVEVDAIGRVRHKNLVHLLGCCVEGTYRILVYEYVNNGNLDQWLHGEASQSSCLTWQMRINIALGAAKALAYLHEALEPKVVHRDIKASNILLDHHWNAKISDFGLAKLLGAGKSHVTTRVMGTFGYVAPEYANTGMLNEKSDVYSFGVLLMEIITGRDPVDYCRPVGQVNLVDWFKYMVASQHTEEVVDHQLADKPSDLELKRTMLVALRCVDMNSVNRPTMGHVVHMLEVEQSPFLKAGGTIGRSMRSTTSSLNQDLLQQLAMEASHSKRIHFDPSDEMEKEQKT